MLHREATTLDRSRGQFDFWLGTWDLRWSTAEGHPRGGSNVISRVLGGAVVLESFTDPVGSDGTGFHGMSASTYDAISDTWQQTWVDSDGRHMSFAGAWDGERMELQRRAVVDGDEVIQRMTWRDITSNSMVWDWERSRDEGATWELVWRIDYRRAAG